jgi:hypothetical protein
MDKEDITYFADDGPSGGKSTDNSKLQIIRFVVGEDADPQKLAEAVNHLRQVAPDELESLHQQIAEPEESCWLVFECLEEYVSLSDDAPERMPDVHLHLQSCVRCSSELSQFREAVQLRDEWVMFSNDLRQKQATPAWLALFKQGWQWLTADQKPVRLDTPGMENEIRLGGFSVRLAAASSYHLAGGFQATPVHFSTLPKEDAPHIDLELTPKRFGTAHSYEWQIEAKLNENSPIPVAHVSIGKADQETSSSRELRHGRNVEFRLPPPAQESYWLYIEWQSSANEWQKDKIELPVRDELNG